ncbi:hypothetical protein LIER_28291 [Lithospermum erythrorhizon]|uniref:Uncharacterized protein n=1 Tax=Lithospermum erythrorhizon TaxID=34254 RepID=A0AAV3RIL7_LITER
MAPINQVTVLESCFAAPPPNTVSEMSHPLSYSDMVWIGFSPVQRLLFYQIPVSRSNFIDTIIPQIKKSVSLALKYFPTLAGNLIIYSGHSRKPDIRFSVGDSISLVFAESSFDDFEFLVSNQIRNCNEFYPLVPQVPKSTKSGGERLVPLLALQVTLFPGNGICIGIANQHVAGDGSSMLSFVKAWAMICKLGEDFEESKGVEFSPTYDRGVMTQHTKKLDDIVWEQLASNKSDEKDLVAFELNRRQDHDKVRATFVVGLEEVKRLKRLVSDQHGSSSIKHLSTFTVICGYVWSCMVKADNAVEELEENEKDFFVCAADFRGRTDPPIPTNYFGNCLVMCSTVVESRELINGENAFVRGAEVIGEAIHKRFENEGGIFHGLENMHEEFAAINWSRLLSIAGSPRQNYYDIDFGWGNPRKMEVPSIDSTGAISLSKCRDDSGGMEIGVVLPRNKMDAFVEYFTEGINGL